MVKSHRIQIKPLWLCFLLLIGQALANETIVVTDAFSFHEESVAKLKHIELDLSSEQISSIDGKDRSIFITIELLEGIGTWTVSGKDLRSEDNLDVVKKFEGSFTLHKPEIFAIGSESELWTDIKNSKKIFLTVKNSGAEESPIKFQVIPECSKQLDVVFGSHFQIHVKSMNSLTFRTKITNAIGNHHYKFMLEELQHHNPPTIAAEGYMELEGAVKSGSNFNFMRFDQSTIGFVVNKEDSEIYCSRNTCDYIIKATFENIKLLDFYVGEHIDYELMEDSQSTVDVAHKDRIHKGKFRKREHLQDPQSKGRRLRVHSYTGRRPGELVR